MCHILCRRRGQGDDQTVQALQGGEGVPNQGKGGSAEFLHQARNQQRGGPLTQFSVEGEGVEIAKAVVMNRGDQALLKIHAVFDATTVAEVLAHT